MKRKSLRELARDPRFIPGVYNYCDRWCERCPLSNRCLNYAAEKADDDGDPASRDLANEKFWQKLCELRQFPKDSDGTAKIALIAIDRSITAWAGLRETLGDNADCILDLLVQLAGLRRETERLFPNARAFVRPGFDPT